MSKLGGWLFEPGGRIVALPAERFEIDLVQDHGARSNQLFALEAVDLEPGRACPVESGKTRSDGVQPPQRAAVVVYVMAHEQPLRDPVHPLRLEQERPNQQGPGRSELPGGRRRKVILYDHSAHSSRKEMRRAWTRSSNGVSALPQGENLG